MIFWEGGTRTESGSVGAPVGTAVAVRHLFFNTPARREYLRAPTTETRRIIETVTDFAGFHHRVAFSLSIDGKPVLRLPEAANMGTRLGDLFGIKVAEMLVPFTGGDAELGVSGFAGKPELARTNRDRILIYVNGRRVWSPSLAHGATAAYGETIPRGRFAFAVIALNVNPYRIDVNVHPTKREVRFANDRAVYDLTYYAINKAIFTSPRTSPVMPVKEEYLPQVPQTERLPLSSSPSDMGPLRESPSQFHPVPVEPQSPSSRSFPATDPLPVTRVPKEALGITNLWQFNDVYIVTVVGEELWVIDQHTAHERILYEEVLRRAHERKPESQRLLFPESIDLEAREWVVFGSAAEVLASLGFEVRPFGMRTVLLEGVPTGLKVKNPVILFRRVLEDVEIASRGGEDLLKAAAASTACRSAVMAGDRLRQEEMQALFARLMHAENPFSCPHGRPTLVKIPIAEFDRKFCRA